MKEKVAENAFLIVRKAIHKWKPISWASYEDDEPDLDPSDTNYEIAKSMLHDELDSTIKSIVKQLQNIKTESDLTHLLHKTLFERDDKLKLEECKSMSGELYIQLKEAKIV